MKLRKNEVVYKGCYVDLEAGERLVDVPTTFKEVGGKRTITIPMPTMVKQAGRKRVPVLVTLRLPKGANVTNWPRELDRKSRADQAYVVSIEDEEGNQYKVAYPGYDNKFRYVVGTVAKPRRAYDPNPLDACSSGIHFFRGKKRAWSWVGVRK